MRVLVIGGGAREHALVWKIRQSPRVKEVLVAPGNAGTAKLARNLDIKPTDIPALAEAAAKRKVDLVVVGPESPLALGIVDHFQTLGIPIFGPTKAAAQIESSKVFSRRLMQEYGIPCAEGAAFDSFDDASKYLESRKPPFVVKADGLAAGKGVVIAPTIEEARRALAQAMVERVFGQAGDKVVIEERLVGREVSLLALTDGKAVVPMVAACDYKRAFDGDQGPNTGGMGGYSPPGFFNYYHAKEAVERVIVPAIQAMAKEGITYRGVLYAGLMVTPGGIKTLEFNARFGDPETQVILPRLKSDIVEAFVAVVEGRLGEVQLEWSTEPCVGVVMASAGYPGSYATGFPIVGLGKLDPDVVAFHAGTKRKAGRVHTDGGRVLTVAATGPDMAEARGKVYRNLERIGFEGCHYRKDIAAREVS